MEAKKEVLLLVVEAESSPSSSASSLHKQTNVCMYVYERECVCV